MEGALRFAMCKYRSEITSTTPASHRISIAGLLNRMWFSCVPHRCLFHRRNLTFRLRGDLSMEKTGCRNEIPHPIFCGLEIDGPRTTFPERRRIGVNFGVKNLTMRHATDLRLLHFSKDLTSVLCTHYVRNKVSYDNDELWYIRSYPT
jgi:hypothetical protein